MKVSISFLVEVTSIRGLSTSETVVKVGTRISVYLFWKEKKLNPILYFAQAGKSLIVNDNLSKIETLYSKHLSEKQNLITSYSSQIEQLSPFNVLERGYSIVRNKKGVVVKSIDNISLEDKISITSAKISYEADITNINDD